MITKSYTFGDAVRMLSRANPWIELVEAPFHVAHPMDESGMLRRFLLSPGARPGERIASRLGLYGARWCCFAKDVESIVQARPKRAIDIRELLHSLVDSLSSIREFIEATLRDRHGRGATPAEERCAQAAHTNLLDLVFEAGRYVYGVSWAIDHAKPALVFLDRKADEFFQRSSSISNELYLYAGMLKRLSRLPGSVEDSDAFLSEAADVKECAASWALLQQTTTEEGAGSKRMWDYWNNPPQAFVVATLGSFKRIEERYWRRFQPSNPDPPSVEARGPLWRRLEKISELVDFLSASLKYCD